MNHRLYSIWHGMLRRCYDSKDSHYKYYGGRGVCVCKQWKNYANFYAWAMLSGYTDRLTIERLDNGKGYRPDNCCWVTKKEQARNKRSNRYLGIGNIKMLLCDWATLMRVSSNTLSMRLRSGWHIKKAVITPILRRKLNCYN
jgi:hypothetical protein